jgi:hypothetical protein
MTRLKLLLWINTILVKFVARRNLKRLGSANGFHGADYSDAVTTMIDQVLDSLALIKKKPNWPSKESLR